MDHIVTMKDTETYAERRAAMAEESRRRILEATVATLARGVEELSMPAVAKEAGVSVPTVYRNFPDKKALMAATLEHLGRLRGYGGPPAKVDDLEASLVREYEKSANLPQQVQIALASTPMIKARTDAGLRSKRQKDVVAMLGPMLEDVAPEDREPLVAMATVLCSSYTMRTFGLLVGASPAEAARTVAWTIRRLLESVGAKKGKKR
jgi:AcrR family transcriptional regulator